MASREETVKKILGAMKAIAEDKGLDDIVETAKTVPMKKTWLKMHDEVRKISAEIEALREKHKVKRALMFATIEEETGNYGYDNVQIDREEDVVRFQTITEQE